MSKSKKKSSEVHHIPHYKNNDCIESFAREANYMMYIDRFDNILRKESCPQSQCIFKDVKAFDFDRGETSLKKKNKNQEKPTVDCVVGMDNSTLVLVEMKFEVKTLKMKNVAKNIKDKRDYSLKIFNQLENFSCYSKVIILLSDKRFEQHKGNLRRELFLKPGQFEIMKVSDFYKDHFPKSIV